MEDLERLRNGVDNDDREMMEALGRRCQKTKEIGRIKSENGLEAYQAERHEAVIDGIREIAEEHEVDPDFAEKVWRVIMSGSVKEQEKIIED